MEWEREYNASLCVLDISIGSEIVLQSKELFQMGKLYRKAF